MIRLVRGEGGGAGGGAHRVCGCASALAACGGRALRAVEDDDGDEVERRHYGEPGQRGNKPVQHVELCLDLGRQQAPERIAHHACAYERGAGVAHTSEHGEEEPLHLPTLARVAQSVADAHGDGSEHGAFGRHAGHQRPQQRACRHDAGGLRGKGGWQPAYDSERHAAHEPAALHAGSQCERRYQQPPGAGRKRCERDGRAHTADNGKGRHHEKAGGVFRQHTRHPPHDGPAQDGQAREALLREAHAFAQHIDRPANSNATQRRCDLLCLSRQSSHQVARLPKLQAPVCIHLPVCHRRPKRASKPRAASAGCAGRKKAQDPCGGRLFLRHPDGSGNRPDRNHAVRRGGKRRVCLL